MAVIRARGEEIGDFGPVRFSEIGSGVLISPDGKVATAAHVVQTMEDITVEFLGEEPVAARVIASEQWADISIVQVSVVPRGATVSKLADSDSVSVGDPVFVVGAPYGLSYSLSDGIVSARWAPDTVTKDFPLAEFFQTTAVINTGNSGGPMFNRAGELIGIVSHNITKSGGSEGLGFVVTSNTVRSLLVGAEPRVFRVRCHAGVGGDGPGPQRAAGGRVPREEGGQGYGGQPDRAQGRRPHRHRGRPEDRRRGRYLARGPGIPMASGADRAKVFKGLESLRVGDDLRFTVLRDEKIVELKMKWTGFPTQFLPPMK